MVTGMLTGVVCWGFDAEVGASSAEKRRITITDYSDSACDHDVEQNKVTLTKNDQDELKWTVTNTCKLPQDVLLCVYRPMTVNNVVIYKLENPFCHCNSKVAGADIASVFNVPSKGEAKLKCHAVGDAETYLKQVLVGPEVPTDGTCPSAPIKVERLVPAHPGGRSRLHQLDIEVQP
jgi:hypothetical protein